LIYKGILLVTHSLIYKGIILGYPLIDIQEYNTELPTH